MPNQRSGGNSVHRVARPRAKAPARTFGESADWSDHHGCEGLYANKPLDLLRCLRPLQWLKCVLLFAAPFFAWLDPAQHLPGAVELQERLGLAVVAFALIASAAYIVNDVCDLKADARDPLRKGRPLAARRVSIGAAIPLAVVCLAAGLGAAWFHGHRFGGHALLWVALAYAALQPLYSLWAKRVAEVGVVIVALGFVARAAAGAFAVDVRLSPWLLLCVFLLTFFVALCKRRAAHFEKGAKMPSAAEGRILDLAVGLGAAATLATYTLYTLASETIALYGTDHLVWTVPLVLLGLCRCLRLTYAERRAANPERLLFDPALLGLVLAWAIACALIVRL